MRSSSALRRRAEMDRESAAVATAVQEVEAHEHQRGVCPDEALVLAEEGNPHEAVGEEEEENNLHESNEEETSAQDTAAAESDPLSSEPAQAAAQTGGLLPAAGEERAVAPTPPTAIYVNIPLLNESAEA